MRKITLLFALLITSIGFSQTYDLLESFNGSGLEGAFGGTAAVYATDPTGTDQVIQIDSSPTGNTWQGVNVTLTSNYSLTSATQLTMQLDVYSTTAITIAPKAQGGVAGAPESVTSVDHTGAGWETLTFTFDKSLDGKVPANGEYADFALHINWDTAGGAFGAPDSRMFYIKNLKGLAIVAVPDPAPTAAAPVPTTGNSSVYSFYNDTNSYTTVFPINYSFGQATDVDLDATSGVNNALKVNTNVDGFGQGEGGPDDISSYDFVNFNYWFSNTKGTAGFVFIMIDNDGAVQEFKYQVGTVTGGDGADLVSDAWTKVSIPMSHFTDLGFDNTKLFQWKIDKYNQSGDNGGFLYLDNIVLTKNYPLSLNSLAIFESKVYPNPASESWNISTPKNVINSVEVFNVLGKRIISQKNNSNDISISTGGLTSGMYLARVTTDLGTKNIKLIKE
jgi:hypothetical protein